MELDRFIPHGTFAFLLLLVIVSLHLTRNLLKRRENLPMLNKTFAFEPSFFARVRWTFFSEQTLDEAYEKHDGQVYRIARGDVDYVVVPSHFVAELNRLPQSTINSRLCHSYSMTGHLNGMEVVLKTNLHVKTMLQRISPALPELLKPIKARLGQTIDDIFPQETMSWTSVKPIDKIVYCVSRSLTLITFGTPACDNSDLIGLLFEHTKLVFTVMFVMRMVPAFLQPILVWLLPVKWRLRKSLTALEAFVVPEVERRNSQKNLRQSSDLLSWMIEEAKDVKEADPYMLTQLLAALGAGGTYSSANFIVSVLLDLVAHPQYLEEIRAEIREKHEETDGVWDHAAFNSLHKLDSAFKETIRLTPGSLTTYSRVMLDDYTLSNGVTLKKGQFICVNSYCRSKDPRIHDNPKTYNALRSYNEDFANHTARPFKNVYGEDFRWGAGRWACAGRFVASIVAKVILVKLLDEYDFQFVDGRRPTNSVAHEFIFLNPEIDLLVRKREKSLGIDYRF